MADTFYFNNEHQDALLACWATRPKDFAAIAPLIKPEYMWGLNACDVTGAMHDYHEAHGIYPTLTGVDGWLHEKYSRDKADVYAEVHEYIEKLKTIEIRDWQFYKDTTAKFCRERAIVVAIKKAADMVKTDKVPEGGFAKMFEDAQLVGQDDTHYKARSPLDLANTPPDEAQALLGKRFLDRRGAALWIGSTGTGKSSGILYAAVRWSAGIPAFGIEAAQPLKILVVQAENDDGDLHEMLRPSLEQGSPLKDEQVQVCNTNLKIVTCNDKIGDAFLDLLQALAFKHKPDLILVDPLQSFLGADPSDAEAVVKFCARLNALISRFNCGLIITCHTPKTRNWDTAKWKTADWAHVAAGNAALSNWARATLFTDSTRHPRVFKFALGKRWQRVGWTDAFDAPTRFRYFAHNEKEIDWREATEAEINEADQAEREVKGGRPKLYCDDAILRPLAGSDEGLSLAELHTALQRARCNIEKSGLRKRMEAFVNAGRVRKEGQNYVLGGQNRPCPNRLGHKNGSDTRFEPENTY